MMAALKSTPHLIDRLPQVRGRLTADAPLAPLTWFKVGGPAEVLFKPADADDLAQFLKGKPHDVAVTVIGLGSNLLVRDGGVPGVVIRLGKEFARITPDGASLTCGAGALDATVALTALSEGLGGLEFLSGVPGTIGGALRMNAGAFGGEIKDVLVCAEAIDPEGNIQALTPDLMDLSYRHCGVPESWIFTQAVLRGAPEDKAVIEARMNAIRQARQDNQPIGAATGGSTFANPDGQKAWQLIDAAGCRGLRVGGAMVSDKHCNFLINTGDAAASDLETLGEEVRRRVRATSGVDLRWEIRRIGVGGKP